MESGVIVGTIAGLGAVGMYYFLKWCFGKYFECK